MADSERALINVLDRINPALPLPACGKWLHLLNYVVVRRVLLMSVISNPVLAVMRTPRTSKRGLTAHH